jgi:hypothetical protein
VLEWCGEGVWGGVRAAAGFSHVVHWIVGLWVGEAAGSPEMGDRRWKMGDGRWEMGDGGSRLKIE